jgi:hypothetical protein
MQKELQQAQRLRQGILASSQPYSAKSSTSMEGVVIACISSQTQLNNAVLGDSIGQANIDPRHQPDLVLAQLCIRGRDATLTARLDPAVMALMTLKSTARREAATESCRVCYSQRTHRCRAQNDLRDLVH